MAIWVLKRYRLLSFFLIIFSVLTLLTYASAQTINGVALPYATNYASAWGKIVNGVVQADDIGSGCYRFARLVYGDIFGRNMEDDRFNSTYWVTPYQQSIPTTADNLKQYILKSGAGAVIRVTSRATYNVADNSGHSMVIIDADNNGASIYQAGGNGTILSGNTIKYWTWDTMAQKCVNGGFSTNGQYIKYIICPPSQRNFNYNPDIEQDTWVYEIVTADGLNMRSTAGTGGNIITTLRSPTRISVTQKVNSDGYTWGYGTSTNGYTGWVVVDNSWTTLISSPQQATAYLDLNGWLDGANNGGLSTYGTADVYVNGNLEADDCNDYCIEWPVGTPYEIKDIKANSGYAYESVREGSLSGTVVSGRTNVQLIFNTVHVSSIALDKTSVDLNTSTARSATLKATVSPANAKDPSVDWSSSNEAVATVNGSGTQATVNAVGAGTATITCTTSDGGKTASCTVTVRKSVTGLDLSPATLTLSIGEDSSLTATVLPSDASNRTIRWSSDNAAVATVNNGVVSGVAAGTAIITATTVDGNYTKECSVTVKEPTPDFTLPAALTEIGEEAFMGIHAERIQLHEGVTTIGKRAFANCSRLKSIFIPESTDQIAADAFAGAPADFVIHGSMGTYAETYAEANGYEFVADDACVITFNANGGICGTASKQVKWGTWMGWLPATTRDYYTFLGWYTDPNSGEQIATSTRVTSDMTLYAHWAPNEWSEWMEAGSLPEGDILTESKTQYRYQDSNYSGWSDWSGWDENRQSTSELKEEDSTTVWYWYRFVCPHCGKAMHVSNQCYTWAEGCGNSIGSSNAQACWLPVSSSSGTQNWLGTGKIMYGSNAYDRWFYWTDSSQGYPNGKSTTGYRYRTRTKSWGSWSEWMDTAVTSSSTRNVETRTLYRYKSK